MNLNLENAAADHLRGASRQRGGKAIMDDSNAEQSASPHYDPYIGFHPLVRQSCLSFIDGRWTVLDKSPIPGDENSDYQADVEDAGYQLAIHFGAPETEYPTADFYKAVKSTGVTDRFLWFVDIDLDGDVPLTVFIVKSSDLLPVLAWVGAIVTATEISRLKGFNR